MEDLAARVHAFRLKSLDVTFFHQLVFSTPQFAQFITRTPGLNSPDEVRLAFDDGVIRVRLQTFGDGGLNVGISCKESDWQILFLAQVCTSYLPPPSVVERLRVHKPQHLQGDWHHVSRPPGRARRRKNDRKCYPPAESYFS